MGLRALLSNPNPELIWQFRTTLSSSPTGRQQIFGEQEHLWPSIFLPSGASWYLCRSQAVLFPPGHSHEDGDQELSVWKKKLKCTSTTDTRGLHQCATNSTSKPCQLVQGHRNYQCMGLENVFQCNS